MRLAIPLLLATTMLLSGCPKNASALLRQMPADDAALFLTLDVFMTPEQQEIYLNTPDAESRLAYVDDAGFLSKWEGVDDEMKPRILAREVVAGMTQDEVYMAWNLPSRVRDTFESEGYIKKLFFTFERDARTGEEFLSPPDSRTAYRNGTFVRYVFMRNGLVERVSDHDSSAPASAASAEREDELLALPEDAPPAEEPAEEEVESAETDEETATDGENIESDPPEE